MTPLEFLTYWRAEPFRPFRVKLDRGELLVMQPMQLAMSPDLQRAALVLMDRTESFTVAEIRACAWLDGAGVAGSAEAQPADGDDGAGAGGEEAWRARLDNGKVAFVSHSEPGGERLTSAAVADRDGRVCFETSGTRWDVHGLEQFENGCSLFLHHLDDPTVEQRVIVWPQSNGTFESFSEAMAFEELGTELRRRDAARREEPRDPEVSGDTVTKPFFRERRPGVFPGRPGRAEPDATDLAERYLVESEQAEVGPNQWASAFGVTDTWNDDVVFDLRGSAWDVTAIGGLPPWSVEARCFPRGDRSIGIRIDADSGMGWIRGREDPLPLSFIERQMHNYLLYRDLEDDDGATGAWDWGMLMDRLLRGPQEDGQPELVIGLGDGYVMELWPGPGETPLPFLTARVAGPKGRVLMDLRGSVWGVMLDAGEESGALTLRFINGNPREKDRFSRLRLELELKSRRVTCGTLDGMTSVGVLHAIAQRARTVSWLEEDLSEAFGRGLTVARGMPEPRTGSGRGE